jgi:transcriptional regulator with XRE-family HTH domain
MAINIEDTLDAIEKYNNTSQEVINRNLKRYFGNYRAERLVEITGMKRATVYAWAKRNGGIKPTFESALRICRALKIELDQLTDERIHEKPLCSVEGCTNDATNGSDLCIRHYLEHKKRGD